MSDDEPSDREVRHALRRDLPELPPALHGPAKLYQNATGAMQAMDTWPDAAEEHVDDPSALHGRLDGAQAQIIETVRESYADEVAGVLDAIPLPDHPNVTVTDVDDQGDR
jgi:hypothetical protein